jgi:Ca-activated chloride channel family protein
MTTMAPSRIARRRVAILQASAGLAAACVILASLPVNAQDSARRRGFSVKVTQPANQDFVIGKTKIAAEVKIDKPEAIEKVEFYVGDKLVFIDDEAPYECLYDFGQESKNLVVKAVAYHREGVTVSDFIVTRKIDISFNVKVNRVVLNASVFDKEGSFVSGLAKTDFTVTEEGARREIVDFAPETRPILMGILIDVSGSMIDNMETAQEAACGFVDTLRETDRAMLVEFNEKVYMLSDLSNNHEHLKKLLGTTKALGGTALYDALHTTLRRLSKFDARKAVVILSDGDDSQSSLTYPTLVEEVKNTDTIIYTIALGSSFGDLDARSKLKELAEQTGGRFFSATKASQLQGVYAKIAEELRSQYYLTYASENENFDGRWVPIKLDTKNKALEVRARKGYYAIPRSSS